MRLGALTSPTHATIVTFVAKVNGLAGNIRHTDFTTSTKAETWFDHRLPRLDGSHLLAFRYKLDANTFWEKRSREVIVARTAMSNIITTSDIVIIIIIGIIVHTLSSSIGGFLRISAIDRLFTMETTNCLGFFAHFFGAPQQLS